MEVTKKQQRQLLISAEHYEETLKDFKDTKVNTNMRLIIFTVRWPDKETQKGLQDSKQHKEE